MLGIISTEHQHGRRQRQRELYSRTPGVFLRFVLSERYLQSAANTSLIGDEVGVYVGDNIARAGAWSNAHCAHKSLGWWRIAGRWVGDFYGKSDDDVRR